MNYEISTTKIMCDKCRKHIKENEYYQHCPTDKENYHNNAFHITELRNFGKSWRGMRGFLRPQTRSSLL